MKEKRLLLQRMGNSRIFVLQYIVCDHQFEYKHTDLILFLEDLLLESHEQEFAIRLNDKHRLHIDPN